MTPPSRSSSASWITIASFGIAATVAVAARVGQYGYDQPGDKHFVNNTAVVERSSIAGGNNQSQKIVATRAQMNATFTRQPIGVDGVREAVVEGDVVR